ncbi:restriction endonuclease subunit S [Vibrio breoganii]|uniref:restriction endonuclease subunit S n=1 Tax=Vibrio breoganii TaxID=553239 RepID=UPI0010BD50E4|nr:restriction endonuclease subunit S [Vibrio breoganii]TKG32470.1 restriction endonuclease subunit S [Vibrio breoganii]
MTKVKLGDVANFINGGAWNQSEYTETGVPVVRVSDIHNATVDLSDCKYLPTTAIEKYAKNKLEKGDLVICTVGSHATQPNSVVGRPGIIPASCQGALLNQNAVCIRPKVELIDKVWLGYLARSQEMKDYIIAHARGSASQVRMAISALKNFEFELPPLSEQIETSTILSNYDDLIANNNRRIAILEDMAQSLYREWFVKFCYPGHEENFDANGDAKLVDSPLGQIPEGWEVKPLGELVEFKRKTVKKGSVPGNTPYMGLEHFPRKSIALSDWEEVSEIGSNKLAFFRGDILFGKIRPNFHKVGVAQVDGLCSSDTFVLSPKEIKHHSLIAMVTFSNEFVAQAVQTAQGSKMPRASWDVLQDFSVCIPDPKALECFNSVVTPAIEQIRVLSLKNRNLKQQSDMLLPKLISGQIELKE